MIFAQYPGHFAAIAVLIITAGILLLAFRSGELKKEKFKLLRVLLLGLKFAVIVILILILWNPSRSEIVETFSRNNVLVLFDTSQSMSVVENSGKTRLDTALKIFDEEFGSVDTERPEFSILGFDNNVYHSGSTQLLRRWGNHTNMRGVLTTIGRQDNTWTAQDNVTSNISRTKGAVIFTDGQADDQRVETYQPLLKSDFPVIIVGVGSRENVSDVEIKKINAPIRALIDSIYEIEVVAAAHNLNEESVTIELLKDDIVIDSAKVPAAEFAKKDDSENHDVTVKFNAGANTLGSHNIAARIKVIANESNQANNIQSTFVDVVDNDKLKVLFYTQAAEFNAGKLRQALSLDPRIDLDFCMDAIRFAGQASQVIKQLNYARFPKSQEEFNKYDIIILESFYIDALASSQIDALYNFVVQRGGGLIILPGRYEYNPAGWKNPKAKLLLPIIFDTNEPRLWPPERQQIDLTTEGSYTIDLAPSQIPEYGFIVSPFYNIEKVKPASSVLASSGDKPLIILHRVGRGKVCMLNISRLFAWYREDKKGGWLYSLMSDLTSYLGQTRGSSSGIELFAERKNTADNKLRFTAYVRDNNFSPVEQANVLLTFNDQVFAMEPSGSGYYVAEIDDVQTDRIVACAQAEIGGVFLGEKPIALNLPYRKTEMSDTKFNEQFLETLAKQLNAEYVYADDVDSDIINRFDARTQAGHTRQITSIWPNWMLWGLLCLILSLEWFVRRAKGLV
jgi:hypothetical protein